jgi:hypothetical protein
MTSEISISNEIYDSIYKAKEILNKEYQDVLEWITDIIENPDRPKRNECEICNSDKNLEEHHVRGHKHGNEIITVCQKCHDTLTVNQRLWDRSWFDPNAENNEVFLQRGLIDICELKYGKTGQEIFKLIAEELKRGFSYE